jgi:hypothetical protein
VNPAVPATDVAPRKLPWRGAALGAVTVTPAIGVAWMHPVINGPSFHRYADARAIFGIPYFGDVISNLPFVLVGLAGLFAARRVVGLPRGLVALFFAGILGIGVGSGVYHVHPMDETLAFDWLPIVLSLGWLSALLLADRVDRRAGRIAAVVLPLAAIASVVWWWAGGGTSAGGDMRWYAFLQLLFVALVPVILLLYPRGHLDRTYLLLGVGCFILARVVHSVDHDVLAVTGISGHTMKHLVAALAAFFVLRAVRRACPAPVRSS